jgi:hypothetical protein
VIDPQLLVSKHGWKSRCHRVNLFGVVHGTIKLHQDLGNWRIKSILEDKKYHIYSGRRDRVKNLESFFLKVWHYLFEILHFLLRRFLGVDYSDLVPGVDAPIFCTRSQARPTTVSENWTAGFRAI